MVQSEWRLLYVLRSMPDERAMFWFVWLHIPLYGLMVWLIHHPSHRVQSGSRNLFAVSLVVHAGIHLYLSGELLYTFNSVQSQTLIYLGALCGLVFLFIGRFSGESLRRA